MQYRNILRLIGELVVLLSAAQVVPLAWALAERGPDARAFGLSILGSLVIGLALRWCCRASGQLGQREAFVVVGLGWIAAGTVASVPFLLSGTVATPIDAFFEAVSGLTTTGASVLSELEEQPAGILIWRALLQWLGGMGIIVLFLAVFPTLGVGGAQLLSHEMAGPIVEKLTPRLRETAKLLWKIYLLFTALQTGLLMGAGLPFYDALLHSFTTISTGGFSSRSLSIAAYNHPGVEMIILVFMVLGGMNFALQYRVFWLREWDRLDNAELKGYGVIIAAATAFVALHLWSAGIYDTMGETWRKAAFQVVSLLTTTGYFSADFNAWPDAARTVLLILLFVGGMAGSTAGGMKIVRLIVLLRYAGRSLRSVLHPHASLPLVLDGKPVPPRFLQEVIQFAVLYGLLFFLSFLILSWEGYDMVTTAGAAIAILGNTGPAFGLVGPHGSYAFFSPWAKLYLALLMIAGRLEVLTLAVLFLPSFWRRSA